MPTASPLMRRIAAAELDKIFPHMAREPREQLTTSIIRQWLTYGGHAGVFTLASHYYLHLEDHGEYVHVGLELVPASIPQLLAPWGVEHDELPDIVWELNVKQSATFVNTQGRTIRVRANALEHGFGVEEVSDEDEAD